MCIIKRGAKSLGLSRGSRWRCMAWRPWVVVELVAESWVSHSGLIAGTVLRFGMLKRHMLRNVKEKAASKTSLSTTDIRAYAQVSAMPLVNVGFVIWSSAQAEVWERKGRNSD